MASKFDAIMARRGEIMRRALGMDYSEFELSPIAFDYERMMDDHGYSLDDIVAIQTKAGVGHTPLLELHNLTDLVRSVSPAGNGARIFVKDEAANLAGAFKDRRASVSIHVAKEKGYEGVIAATSGNYGAAVASQAARASLRCIIVQETYDSRKIGQPEIVEKARICEAYGAEVVQLTIGPELFAHFLDLLDQTGYFAASLYSSFGVSGIETLGLEVAEETRALTGAYPDCLRHHPRRRRQHHRHRSRPAPRWRHRHADRGRLGRPVGPAHGLRRRLQPQELHYRPHRLRRAVCHLARSRRRTAQRGPAAALHRPLPHGHPGRGLLYDRGSGQARRPRAWPGRQHGHDRRRLAGPRAAPRGHRRGAGDRIHRRRQAPLGAAQLRPSRWASRCARATRATTSRVP